jgi:hypothetical protein
MPEYAYAYMNSWKVIKTTNINNKKTRRLDGK